MKKLLFSLACISMANMSKAQSTYSYTVYKANENITIDGSLTEWTNTPYSESFTVHNTSIAGINTPKVQLMWDDNNLYVAFHVLDSDIKSTSETQDALLWEKGDMIEFILDFDGNNINYLEIGVNTNGNNYENHIVCTPSTVGCSAWTDDLTWDISGLETAASINGTANDGTGDTGFDIELKIPFAGLNALPNGNFTIPTDETTWKGNFMALNFNTNTTGTIPTEYLSWSTYPAFGFHQPNYFGSIVFSNNTTAIEESQYNTQNNIVPQGNYIYQIESIGNGQVVVYDLVGKIHLQKTITSSEYISLASLPNGCYIINAMNEKTQRSLRVLKP